MSKESHILKAWLHLQKLVLFLSTVIQLIVSIQSAKNQSQLIQNDQFDAGKSRLLYLE